MKQLIIILLSISAIGFTGCNNDIFIESSQLPDETYITLDGNGDEWSVPLPRYGLKRVYLDGVPDADKYLKYYNIKSGLTDSYCPPSELNDIIFENPVKYYSVTLSGNMLYISCSYNVSDEDNITLRLEYDYGVSKTIHFTLTTGGKMELLFPWYEEEPVIEENFEEIIHVDRFTNNGPVAQQIEIMPYLQSQCSHVVNPEDSWATDLVVDMPLLSYSGNKWELKDFKEIRLGDQQIFSPSDYFSQKITVDVPPYTKATVTYALRYSRATQHGNLFFYNSVSRQEWKTNFSCTSIYATVCDYSVSYE